MRRLLLCLTMGLLAGCAATRLDVNVHSHGTWPNGRAPGAYAFQRLPSQRSDEALQQALEAAARTALQRAGFVPADDGRADVLVQLAARKSEAANYLPGPYADPFWAPYGPLGVHGGAWGARRWDYGLGWGAAFGGAVVYYDVFEVSLLILDAHSQASLYESRAKSVGTGDMAQTWAALLSAALMDFPYNAVSPRQVVVPLRAPAAAASAPP